jgi:hypothetical protein
MSTRPVIQIVTVGKYEWKRYLSPQHAANCTGFSVRSIRRACNLNSQGAQTRDGSLWLWGDGDDLSLDPRMAATARHQRDEICVVSGTFVIDHKHLGRITVKLNGRDAKIAWSRIVAVA